MVKIEEMTDEQLREQIDALKNEQKRRKRPPAKQIFTEKREISGRYRHPVHANAGAAAADIFRAALENRGKWANTPYNPHVSHPANLARTRAHNMSMHKDLYLNIFEACCAALNGVYEEFF